MIEIVQIETFLLDLPTIRRHVLSMTAMNRQTVMIVAINCSDGISGISGISGIGDGTTIGGLSDGCESPEGLKLAIDTYIAPVLRPCDASRLGEAMARIGRAVVGNHFAKCA